MAKYAGTVSTEAARALPTYQRQHYGTGITSGFQSPDFSGFARSSIDRRTHDLRGLDDFLKGASDLADVVAKLQIQRETRDNEVKIHEMLRNRSVEVTSTRTGANADNLLKDEEAWLAEQRESFIEESTLFDGGAGAIFDSAASSYKDKIGVFMVQQNKIADEQSKKAALTSYRHDLSLAKPGDFEGFMAYRDNVSTLYEVGSYEHQTAMRTGLDMYIDTSLSADPRETLRWFSKNSDNIRQILGPDFPDAKAEINRTQERLNAKYRAAVAARDKANRQAVQQQIYSEQGLIAQSEVNDFMPLLSFNANLPRMFGSDEQGAVKAQRDAANLLLSNWIERDPEAVSAMMQDPARMIEAIGVRNIDLLDDLNGQIKKSMERKDFERERMEEKTQIESNTAFTETITELYNDPKVTENTRHMSKVQLMNYAFGKGMQHKEAKEFADTVRSDKDFDKTVTSRDTSLALDQLNAKAKLGELTPEAIKRLASNVTKEQLATALALNNNVTKFRDEHNGLEAALDYIYSAMTTSEGFGMPVPSAQKAAVIRMQAQFTEEYKKLKTDEEKRKLCSLEAGSPLLSYVANYRPDIKSTLNPSITIPYGNVLGNDKSHVPDRASGETVKDYLMRVKNNGQ